MAPSSSVHFANNLPTPSLFAIKPHIARTTTKPFNILLCALFATVEELMLATLSKERLVWFPFFSDNVCFSQNPALIRREQRFYQ
jgi:hypothetical protein